MNLSLDPIGDPQIAVGVQDAHVAGAQPAVQGTVRALWAAKEAARNHALPQAPPLITLGNLPPDQQTALFRGRAGSTVHTR